MKKHLILILILSLALASSALAHTTKDYDNNKNYLALMIKVVESNDENALSIGATYEKERNIKITDQQLSYKKTAFFTKNRGIAEIRKLLSEYIGKPKNTYYSNNDVAMIAKVMYKEARGISNIVELACIAWTILNRVDAGYGSIQEVITAPFQFSYSVNSPTTNDYGIDLLKLSRDVLSRWEKEKNGEIKVGRVLPSDYLWFSGNGKHNYFKNAYKTSIANIWNYSLPNPY